MANKRIQKKRAKAVMLEDKSKLIANMIAMFNADSPRHEQIKIAKMLWPMSIGELLRVSDKALCAWINLHSPLRPMILRDAPIMDWSSVVGWRPTISNVRERT